MNQTVLLSTKILCRDGAFCLFFCFRCFLWVFLVFLYFIVLWLHHCRLFARLEERWPLAGLDVDGFTVRRPEHMQLQTDTED